MDPGKHIKWKICEVPFDRLVDLKLISGLLGDAVEAAGMRTLGDPVAYDIPTELRKQGADPDPNEPEGVTAFVVLSTSHAVIHTWPRRRYAFFDLYSCCDFDPRKVEGVFIKALGPKRFYGWDLSYSLRFENDDKLRGAAKEALTFMERVGGPDMVPAKRLRSALNSGRG